MTEEKILQEEALDDEELEGVVGGYYDTWKDYQNFVKLGGGYVNADSKQGYSKYKVMAAFQKIGQDLGLDIKADLVYDSTPGKSPNRYYLEGEQISRDELWAIINEGYDALK